MCCSLRSSLADTLHRILRRAGQIKSFKRIIVETTGLADPTPILKTFVLDRGLNRSSHLRGIVTVVDAATCLDTFARHPEATAQVAVADRIAVTKTDLVDETITRDVASMLDRLNPRAPRRYANHGRLSESFFFDDSSSQLQYRCEGPELEDKADHCVGSYYVTVDQPLQQDVIFEWLEMLLSLTRGDVLRVKGILNLIGFDQPVVIHGVQHLVHSPYILKDWPPDHDHTSCIVVITRDIDADLIEDTLHAVGIRCRLHAGAGRGVGL